ncbi:hypothetical protein Leryth_025321 [Lithospermum erythrorhizon]|nr:hypothetical protein Leryth_025321 [Lithospermum erythrorhizon]
MGNLLSSFLQLFAFSPTDGTSSKLPLFLEAELRLGILFFRDLRVSLSNVPITLLSTTRSFNLLSGSLISLSFFFTERAEVEQMKDHRSHIRCKYSHHLLQAATAAQSMAVQGSDKEDEVDRLQGSRTRFAQSNT